MKIKYLSIVAALAALLVTACTDDSADPLPAPTPEPPKETQELGNISTNTVLDDIFTDPATPDYRVSTDIEISATLTIRPGVVIEVAGGKGIVVNAPGFISAVGEQNKKIIFRGKTQAAGFWKGMIIYSSSQATVLEHVEIAHTGSALLFDGVKAAIGLFGAGGSPAKLSIRNSTLHHNAGYGIYVASNAQFIDFASNTFRHHAEAGLYMTANQVQKLDAASQFTDNAKAGIEVFSGTIEGTGEVVWPGYHYRYSSGSLSVRTGWKVMAGAVIEMADDQYIEVADRPGAYIHAAGTAEKKVTFTSVSKQAGAWQGISIFTANAANLLEHAVVEHGHGGSAISYGVKANIYVPFSNRLSIRNSKISSSGGYGIYYRSSAVLNEDIEQVNTFEANPSGNLYRD
ncbi:right-handed parallel beta-helix repeat-containing protein [Cesiribacter sp. SM1]|uniref:right-handed parallel beta-helix repeat-containing protein n=1 Tax=Cesiribacter sp. SM1 TaxID=2861196 RepID=UPI001CD38C12|nr:right-handed parallel beta-helix repeat-containing protein [Cesiribacter sp. SM1]